MQEGATLVRALSCVTGSAAAACRAPRAGPGVCCQARVFAAVYAFLCTLAETDRPKSRTLPHGAKTDIVAKQKKHWCGSDLQRLQKRPCDALRVRVRGVH